VSVKKKEPKHNPRYPYDCERCKFSWCCGYKCACVLRPNEMQLKATPAAIQNKVIEAHLPINPSMTREELREDYRKYDIFNTRSA
jgi:hypothetical protein